MAIQTAFAQQTTVKGLVEDAMGPVIGATVISDSGAGTTTGIDGTFELSVGAGEVITVSYVGYKSQEIVYSGQTFLSFKLVEENATLDAVVVTALGIKRSEKALSYSVQQVKAEELTSVKDANFMNSLVGKVAGVTINSGSGGPGATTRVVMRGEKSIEKGNNALYVIDGIPMYNHRIDGGAGTYGSPSGSESSADINPEDIESINMLTGPSAAALYGSDAANGVVIINTKRGAKDHTNVTISNSTTFSKVYMLPQMQSVYASSGGYMNWGERRDNISYDPEKFFQTGSNVINSVSLSTGNQKNQTYISASTTNATGIITDNSYDRYNFTARNTTSFAKDKLVLDLGANFIIQKDRNMVSQGKYYNPLPAVYLFPRGEDFDEVRLFERWDPVRGYMTQYWPYGEGNHSMQNPYWLQKRIKRESDKRRYMLNASLKWNITDWMNISGRVRVDNSEYRQKRKFYASTLTTFAGMNGGYRDVTQHDRNFYGDVMLNIDKEFGDWTLNANIGASINDQRFEEAGGAGDLLLVNQFSMKNVNYAEKYQPVQNGWHDQNQAVFASVEVGWKSMLYLTVTGRNDWASQLAFTRHNSFFYPSAGLSAVVSNMVRMPEWFSFLKVRGSYSQVASAFKRFIANPSYKFNEQTHNWQKPTTYPASNLKPEDTKSWEVGINARFFNHLTLDVTYYRSNTYHQTIYAPMPSSSGYKDMIVQTGDVQNQGMEFALGYNNKWGDFTWNSSFTLTLNRNLIKSLADNVFIEATGETFSTDEIKKDWLGASNVAPQVILRPGGSMSDIYINHELKRDDQGYVLVDKGNLTMEETEMRKAGSLAPRYNLGWANSFGFKGLELGLVFTARVGGLTYSATQGILDYYGTSQASADYRDQGGVPINFGRIDTQKYYSTISSADGGHGAYYLYSASNIRLQELSLNYTLPKKWFNNKARLTVGFIAKNLWMIYCKAPFDPEVSASTSSSFYQGVDYFMQPSTRNFGFNVKLQF